MLENHMGVQLNDVEDLFGDAVGLGLAPAQSQDRHVQQRLEELKRRGCSQ